MFEIAEKFRTIKEWAENQPNDWLFTRANRRNLEWLILGSVCELLATKNLDRPSYAAEKESPDFIGYHSDEKTIWSGVEVTEVIEPGRKRNEEMRVPLLPGQFVRIKPPLTDPFGPLRTAIQKKSEKKYAAACVLLVYFNIGDWALSYDANAFIPMLQDEAEARSFILSGQFRRVLVLDATMTRLIELMPHT